MSSMGMDKNGQQTLASTGVWTKLLSFTVRSGYPSTVITGDCLVMNITGTGDLRFQGNFTFSTAGQQFRVVKNGVTVVGPATNAGTTGTASGISVVPGDTLELQAITSTGGAFAIVDTGATKTWLEFNQVTSNQFIGAAVSTAWNRTAALALTTGIGAVVGTAWARSASLSVNAAAQAALPVQWNIAAGLYLGQFYNAAAARPTNWNISASLLHVPKTATPPSAFSFADVSVSVHTASGRHVGDIPCNIITSWTWGRESTEVSTAEITFATEGNPDLVEDLRQWVHWVTIWHDDLAVWTGPIQVIKISRAITVISARDVATFMQRTRVPITRTFSDTNPARIADVLWRSMLQLHSVRVTPQVLSNVVDETFTIAAQADSRMLNQLMDDLVKVGLVWTVYAGRPILGQFPTDPVAELQECDFLVELERRRDGTQTFNDVRVQGQNWSQTAIVEMAGLHLQTLVSLDDMFGAANIQRATQQYARESATLRDQLVIPAGASLHPQAQVTFEDLCPGKVFVVHSEKVSQLMRLDQVTVTGSPESFDVQVGLVALGNTGDIAKLVGGSH